MEHLNIVLVLWKEYFEAIDTVKGELRRTFHQENFLFIRSVEAMLINGANGRKMSLSPRFKKLYKNDYRHG